MENQLEFNKKSRLPEVSWKGIATLMFCFPVSFYPLLILLGSALKEPEPGIYETVQNIIEGVIWFYPVVLISLSFLLSKIYDRNEKLGKRLFIGAIILEFVVAFAFLIYLIPFND